MKAYIIRYEWPLALSASVLCLLLAYPMFGVYLFSPNQYMYAFGGDAFAIYFDIAWHVCHGKGDMFRAMNYPHGELIFLTDAQGALSVLLSWIHHHLFEICDYTIGIVHALNAWSVILCSGIIYYLFRALKTDKLTALLFSPLITLLSPQILRLGGHFGLAYPFVLPLTILWFIRKCRISQLEWRDLLYVLLMLFMTFNNPYVGVGAGGFIFLAGGWTIVGKKNTKAGIIQALTGLMIMAIPFLYFKLNDPVDDRIKLQWGFFHYYAKLEGMFFTPGSLMDKLLYWITGKGFEVDFETKINLGLPVILIVLTYFIIRLFNKERVSKITAPEAFKALVAGGLLLFIYASAFLLMAFDKEWVEDKLGPLLMFKAVARLAWPMYFIITIGAIYFLSQITATFKRHAKAATYIFFITLWIWEIRVYVQPYFENVQHSNFFSRTDTEYMHKLLQYGKFNPDSYQAILALPKMMMWNDNFISDLHFNTQFYSMRISHATGIPLISSMLSRMSVQQMAEAIELHSDPLIEKSLPEKFPDRRDIMIVLGKDHPPLSNGVQLLVETADTLLDADGFILMGLPLDKINKNKYITQIKELCNDNPVSSTADARHTDFNTPATDIYYYGGGALLFDRGTHLVMEEKIEVPLSTHYIFSAWTRFDHYRYGIGKFRYIVQNQNGEIIFDESPDTRRSNDIHDEWIRSEMRIPVETGCKVQVFFIANRPLYIDELILRPDHQNHWISDEKSILFNGIRIRR